MSARLKSITDTLQAQQAATDQEYKVFAPAAANAMLAKSQDPLFGAAHYLGLLGKEANAQRDSAEQAAQQQAFMKEIMQMDIDAEIKAELIKQVAPMAAQGIMNSVVPLKEYGIIDPVGAIVNDGTRISEREAGTRKIEAEAIGELYDAGIRTSEDRVANLQRSYTEPTTPVDGYNAFDSLTGYAPAQTIDKQEADAATMNAETNRIEVNQRPMIARIGASGGGRSGNSEDGIKWEVETGGFSPTPVVKYKGKGAVPQHLLGSNKPISPFLGRQ